MKGRDWYDFEYYVRHGIPLNYTHLRERIRLFNGEELNFTEFKNRFKEHLAATDVGQVKADVLPFVKNPKELDTWSNDYFLQLAEMVNVKE